MYKRALLLSPLFLLIFLQKPVAQSGLRIGPGVVLGDTTQLHQLVLVNFTQFLGVGMDIDGNELVFQLRSTATPNRFPIDEVRFLGLVNQDADIGYAVDPAGPVMSDLTYLRTALPAEGKGRFRNVSVTYSIAEFNVNKNIQLGIGLLTPVGPLATQRFQFSVGDHVHLGISNQMTLVVLDPFIGPFLIGDLTANLTLGNSDGLLNVGYGLGYDTSFDNIPTIRFGGGGRIANSWHVYGELAIFEGEFETSLWPSVSAAYGKNRHRWRFGLFTGILDGFEGPPLPLVGYDYHW
ncbi:MAG: hypothetical protein AAFQ37_02740 [Bacteroidota bacterium]